MLFNSVAFLVFFPVVFIIYISLQKKPVIYQNILLLISSYIFYSFWDWRFLGLIVLSTIADYCLGLKINSAHNKKLKKTFLIISLVLNLGILGFFKYYNFFVDSIVHGLSKFGLELDFWTLNIILPVGISFYTFQTLSYSIDIYKGKIKPAKDIISFAVFVAFFPQLVAGPIERAHSLLPQFLKKRTLNYNVALTGISLITYGFFKKIVIADRLAIYVNSIFSDISQQNTISLLLGVIFFSFQIYADFSGYSLIARGLAKLLGFDLMVNFNKPYLSTNISEFWKRWHISLSTWFRDYLYIPLGGSRVSGIYKYFNIIIVFLISGLWHGANWTFVIWGALHSVYLLLYIQIKNIKLIKINSYRLKNFINVMTVYILVTFAWIFFRAENIDSAFLFIEKIFNSNLSLNLTVITAGNGPVNLFLSLCVILFLYLTYLLPKDLKFKKESSYLFFNSLAILFIIIIGVNGKAEFIYFQF